MDALKPIAVPVPTGENGHENFDAVVIGSGFGGTVAALSLARCLADRKQRVCLLERGQWWISHEVPYRTQEERKLKTLPDNMREILQDKEEPYNFWAHPDNVEGLIDLGSKSRLINRAGLYDYRPLGDNIHVICASGMGGGSLVYSNVTLEPPKTVYENWPTERTSIGLEKYFKVAQVFMGVNRITTVSGLGPKNVKLDKSRMFQAAAHKVAENHGTVLNHNPNDPDFGFAVELSITEVPVTAFSSLTPLPSLNEMTRGQIENILSTPGQPVNIDELISAPATGVNEVRNQQNQQNVCQRQGRCNLGCLPGARHTLNKKIIALMRTAVVNEALTVKALSEADRIKFDGDKYIVRYRQVDRDTGRILDPAFISTKILVVAAGTLGTTELLLKSREDGGLELSDALGKHFSTDGDLIGFLRLSETNRIDMTRGPINTCHALFTTDPDSKRFDFSIEDTTLPRMVAPLFATMFDLVPLKGKDLEDGGGRPGFLSRLKTSFTLVRRYGLIGFSVLLLGLNLSRFLKVLHRLWNNDLFRELLERQATANNKPPSDTRQPTKHLPDPWKSPLDQPAGVIVASLLEWLTKDYEKPFASPEERLSKYFVFSCMGQDKADGEIGLRPGWRNLEDKEIKEGVVAEKLEFKGWPDWVKRNSYVFDQIIGGMRSMAAEIEPKKDEVYTPTWSQEDPKKRSLVLLHPLGGCRMGRTIDDGVVNSYGQVYRNDPINRGAVYPNFYVMDGSIVPSALGVNSSLTIAALAFRCVESLLLEMGATRRCWPDWKLMQQMLGLSESGELDP